MKILISKYKEVTDLKCRAILCEIVLNNNHLIKISNEFFIDNLDPGNDESNNPFSK